MVSSSSTVQPRYIPRRTNTTNNQVHLSNPITYKGDNLDIGCVIGMRYEKFHKKVPFETFVDNMDNYAMSNLKDGASLRPLFKKKTDSVEFFKKN